MAKPPSFRVTLCLDNGRNTPATFQDLGLLWESDKRNGTYSGRLSLVGDLTLHAGAPLSILVQPIVRGSGDAGADRPGERDEQARDY